LIAPRRLGLLAMAVVLGLLSAGGATYLSPSSSSRSPAALVPGYGGPVNDQQSGALSVETQTTNELEAAGTPSRPQRVPGSFIVALAPGQDPHDVAMSIARDYGGEAGAVYDEVIGGFQFLGPDDAGKRMASDPRIRSVQPDYEAHLAESGSLPLAHLVAIDQPAAISAGNNGHGVRIGILDTGADLVTQPDLTGQVASDSTDATGSNCTSPTGSVQDQNGHGTRTTSNAVGLNGIGVAPGAKAVLLKVMDSSGRIFASYMTCAINYIVGLNSDTNTTNDVQVVNASIAGGGGAGLCNDGGLRQAVCTLVNGTSFNGHTITKNAAFFAAAGNSGADTSDTWPANYPEAIAVSAFDCSSTNCSTTAPRFVHSTTCVSGGFSWSSNYGSIVDLGAPGNDIYSSARGGGHELSCGTSRASPIAAGAAADLLSAVPGLSPAQIKADLQKGGECPDRAVNNLAGNCASSRGSWSGDPDGTSAVEPFVDVARAISAAGPSTPTVPGAPTGVTATAGNAQATVTWTAPSNGGSTITKYTVTSSPGGVTATVLGSPPATSATVGPLTNGTSYTFTVKATNAQGDGPSSSSSNSVTPATVPGAPTGVTATAGNQSATVTWTAPSNGGSVITRYTVTSSPAGGTAIVTGSPPATSTTVTGLAAGTSYTFTVKATNAVGDGPSSDPSNAVTPTPGPTVPDAPTGVTATAGNAQATVTWTAPSNGGSTITKYTVTSNPGGVTATVLGSPPATSATVSPLTNGTSYTFTVKATNAQGDGPSSVPSNAVTPTGTTTTFYSQNFDNTSNVSGWTVSSSNSTVKWHLSNSCGSNSHSPTGYAVYYGNDSSCTYSTGSTNSGTLISPIVSKPTTPTTYHITFLAKRAVESCSGCTRDQTYVDVNFQDGGGWRRVYYADAGHAPSSPNNVCTVPSGTGFQTIDCTLGNGTGKVQVHWVFNTTDSTANSFFGWSVDDFTVHS